MRLGEMESRSLPCRAGKATIEWYQPEGGIKEPFREKSVLHLPKYTDAELFRLQPNYNQFLFCLRSKTWFAGTDEKPFLVQLSDDAFRIFLNGRATGFYHNLLPTGLIDLAQQLEYRTQFGVPERQTYIRQGDIFALPLPLTWKDIETACFVRNGCGPTILSKPIQVFGTRHQLSFGHYLISSRILGRDLALVAEGTITARTTAK